MCLEDTFFLMNTGPITIQKSVILYSDIFMFQIKLYSSFQILSSVYISLISRQQKRLIFILHMTCKRKKTKSNLQIKNSVLSRAVTSTKLRFH